MLGKGDVAGLRRKSRRKARGSTKQGNSVSTQPAEGGTKYGARRGGTRKKNDNDPSRITLKKRFPNWGISFEQRDVVVSVRETKQGRRRGQIKKNKHTLAPRNRGTEIPPNWSQRETGEETNGTTRPKQGGKPTNVKSRRRQNNDISAVEWEATKRPGHWVERKINLQKWMRGRSTHRQHWKKAPRCTGEPRNLVNRNQFLRRGGAGHRG